MLLFHILRSVRPRQWIKNLVVFAAITFGGQLLLPQKFFPVLQTFMIFNILASGVYLINDVIDIRRDKLHYFKKNRPIAKGLVSPLLATVIAITLVLIALLWGYYLNKYLFLMLSSFLVIQVLYTFHLKHIIILDVITIAATFMIRIFSGLLVVSSNYPITSLSSWLILTTIMLALFLAIAKRRLELTLMTQKIASEHRDTLSLYPTILLDGMTFMTATATILTYSLFTFNEPETYGARIKSLLPEALSTPKWLMITIPWVIYGIFRYLYLIYGKSEGESPERLVIEDLPMLATVISWGAAILIIVYLINQ